MSRAGRHRQSAGGPARAAAGTLLLTGVASAATVLVLTQASTFFVDTTPGRSHAGSATFRPFAPITVLVAPKPPAHTPTSAPPGTHPVSDPSDTAAPPTQEPPAITPDGPTTAGPVATPTATPTPTTPPTPTDTPTPAGPPTPTDTPVAAPRLGSEVGKDAGKGFLGPLLATSTDTHGRGLALGHGETAHIYLCTTGRGDGNCGTGYDLVSPLPPAHTDGNAPQLVSLAVTRHVTTTTHARPALKSGTHKSEARQTHKAARQTHKAAPTTKHAATPPADRSHGHAAGPHQTGSSGSTGHGRHKG